ncbi:MAG TPA: isoprenylcysteine carboxylmethyltransferase family protein [Candidatus Krumholzibacteria bacterium]
MNLELKIPPLVVAALLAAGMWGLSHVTSPVIPHATLTTSIAIVLAILGLGFSIAGDIAFHRARTTVNPLKPGNASRLVTTGVYRVTRNPMYVGVAFVLTAFAVYRGNAWAVAGPAAFVLYITRFQIVPEERILSSLFGEQYTAYTKRVRRWV